FTVTSPCLATTNLDKILLILSPIFPLTSPLLFFTLFPYTTLFRSILQRYLSRFSSLSFAMHAHSLYYSTMHQKSNFRHIVVIILPKFEPHLVHIHTDCSFLSLQ